MKFFSTFSGAMSEPPKVDEEGNIGVLQLISSTLKQPKKTRSAAFLKDLVHLIKDLPFFQDRGLKETAISDTLTHMTYKEIKKDEFVMEYG